jgi:protoporphyrinogen oxidase
MYDYIIIGAGITGVTFGRLLQERNQNNFLNLEKECEIGGLCRTKIINDHVLDIGGGHFLCSNYQDVYDFIFSHIPKSNFNCFAMVSKIALNSNIIDYPIESNLWQLPVYTQVKHFFSVIKTGSLLKISEPQNYKEWIYWKMGKKIGDEYMLPYNNKLWGVEPEQMDIDWLHKIPQLDLAGIFKSFLLRHSDRNKIPSHQYFFYPQKGGFQEIFNAIAKKVKDNIISNFKITSLEFNKNHWLINNKYKAKIVINTAPWTSLFSALGSPKNLSNDFRNLKYNSIVISLWEEAYANNWHWLYKPSLQSPEHRIFYISNFAPHSKKQGLYTETNLKRFSANKMLRHGKKALAHFTADAAYPIPTLGSSKSIANILNFYKEKNLHGLGRWGQWQYFNSDVCILEAMKLAKELN